MADASGRTAVAEEDLARADCYGVISRLFYAPPDEALLQSLGTVSEGAREDRSGGLQLEALEDEPASDDYAAAFERLRQACRGAEVEALCQEYDALFIAAGRAPVTPYTSGYADPSAPDRHLVALREHLARWGLARRVGVFEVEDHVSAVCDIMRWLIQHEHPLAVQRAFFDDFVYTAVGAFCGAVRASPVSAFYRSVADMTTAFLAVERQAFDMHVDE